MTFGERLKAARENAKLTQSKLAERSGISMRTIINWENGVRKPSNIEKVNQLSTALGVPVTSLLDSSEEFVIGIGETYGARGRKGAEKVLADVNALFAGGEMADEDLDTFMQAVQQAYWEVKKINREKYTPKKYRKEDND